MANKIIEKCPCCGENLIISRLSCKNCGVNLDGEFDTQISAFENLDEKSYSFLWDFLSARGSLKTIQEKTGKNYFQVKAALDNLLLNLGIENEKEKIDMKLFAKLKMNKKSDSNESSDIIKNKLIENNGSAWATEYSGKEFNFSITNDGEGIRTKKLPMFCLEFKVFDIIEKLLIDEGGRASKGNARSVKLGEENCTYDTVAGRLGYEYFGKNDGDSFFDCGFIAIAIMEWAGIIRNKRGYIEFTPEYMWKIRK